MSNKTLAYTLIAVILLIAAGVAGWSLYANRNSKVELKAEDQNQNNETQKSSEQTNQQTEQINEQQAQEQQTAACARNFDQEKLKNATVDIKNRTVQITVKDFGIIKAELYDKDAPKTVENFLRLANAGYFDCVTFHRVSKGFVIQGGDPTGTGSGGDSAFGKEFADELNPETVSFKAGYVKGVLAMANRGANTNTSQFFIMLDDVTSLPHGYTIFGKVSEGQDVVDKIGQVEITPVLGPTDGTPKTPVVMESIKIIE